MKTSKQVKNSYFQKLVHMHTKHAHAAKPAAGAPMLFLKIICITYSWASPDSQLMLITS